MTLDDLQSKRPPALSRRAALGAALSLGLPAAFAASPASAATLDPTNPQDAKQIYRKMRYRTDSGLIFAWVKGPHLAEVGAQLTPMYAINLGTIQRVTQRPDGGFEVRDLEITFITDVETGKPLKAWRNPITGDVLNIEQRTPRPASVSYTRDNDLRAPATYQGAKFEVTHYPVATFAVGDDVYVRERTYARLSGSTERTLNEISTFCAPRSVVLDPKATWVDAKVQSNDVSSWPAWLKMGAAPGMLALYGVGGKVRRFEDMPGDWLDMLHEAWPKIAADPIAALDQPLGA